MSGEPVFPLIQRDWAALRQQVAIPGGWQWETVKLAEQEWQLLVPADQNAFLESTATSETWPDPYWARVWPAARWLAAWVLARDWSPGCEVLELGCGSGLVGLAAAAKGCRVTLSDYVPLAVELAVANVRGNGFSQVTGEVLDWRAPLSERRHEVILAADVIYDPELHQPLLNVLLARLSPGGCAWLADPGRSDLAASFLHLATEAQWKVELTDEHGERCDELARGEFRLIGLRR